MTKAKKWRLWRWGIALAIILILGTVGFVRRTQIAAGLSNWLTQQTIPFNWVVSPDAAAAQETVKGVSLDGMTPNSGPVPWLLFPKPSSALSLPIRITRLSWRRQRLSD